METKFKSCDNDLQQLVEERREEVVRSQKKQAARLKDTETRGQAQLTELRKTLPKELATTLKSLDRQHDEAAKEANSEAEKIRAEFAAAEPSGSAQLDIHPGLAGGHLVAPNSLGWFTPYYGTLHDSNGNVAWSGYNPGNIDLGAWATGGGSGLFGTGAGSFTVYMDWWFSYVAPTNRNYAHTIWVPFHGFYIVRADDGFWTSKEAHTRIDLSAVGYQYNYKPTGNTNVFDLQSQNIDVNDRFDGWRTMYYSDLLGADRAYLRVTASFYVYARGGGSRAELNFAAGNANYMGVPWVYVD
jgi:hypothetical protein